MPDQTDAITSFEDDFRFLSNFSAMYPIPFGTWESGAPIIWKTSEHIFQAMKAGNPSDRRRIWSCNSPAGAKRLARALPRPNDWDNRRIVAMQGAIGAKFRIPEYAELLLATGDRELIEGNTWGGVFWEQCPLGEGENMLGQILMQMREELHGQGS